MINEDKYVNLVSPNLRNFKKLSGELYNFSCPICGDSQTNKRKARGYIYKKDYSLLFHCHNCSTTLSFKNFLKEVDPNLYKEYVFENFKNTDTSEGVKVFAQKMKAPKFLDFEPIKKLVKISKLKDIDPVRKYVIKRKIPSHYHFKLFSCPKFKKFTNDIIFGKFSKQDLEYDETRLLIPFIDSNNKVHAYQGRAIGESKLKYVTIVLDESVPKVYGLDTTNFTKDVFVFEGPIDSMFIPNSIATAGGDIASTINKFDKSNMIIVYDNEPRSIHTKKKIDKAINLGYSVCLWPENIMQKDVNDMVLSGTKPEVIEQCIKQNTYKDLSAKLALAKWSKV
jgi:hypothetical protein